MTSTDRSIEAWPASLLTVGRLRALLQDLPDDLPVMACVPENDGLGAYVIDVLDAEPSSTLRPRGGRARILEMQCAWAGQPAFAREPVQPGASVTLQQDTLDQAAREALMEEVLDLTAERFGKGRGMGASFDEEQSLLTWEWYGPQSEERAQLAREYLEQKGFSGLG